MICFLKLSFWMSRPLVSGILLLFAYTGAVQPGQTLRPNWNLLLISWLVILFLVNAASVNDLADEKIDRINLAGSRARPLASGRATRADIKLLAILSAATALIVSLLINPVLLLIVATGLAFNWVYSAKPVQLSHRGFLAPLLLPLAYVVVPFMIGAIATDNRLITIIKEL